MAPGETREAAPDPFADPRYPNIAETYGGAPGDGDGAGAGDREPAAAPPPRQRVEGPGDAYDWPWNRRSERFPEEDEAQAAPPRPAEGETLTRPSPPAAEPAAAAHEAAPEAPRTESLPPPEPVPADPAGPVRSDPEHRGSAPRRGWWRRLTN